MPREDATVVMRLLDAGAHIVGKTAVPGVLLRRRRVTGYPDAAAESTRTTRRTCAGASSNGSAVVVVDGEADMALGGDQGGSIRMPASWSGCCGHKPTQGPRALHRDLPDRADARPHRADGAHACADCALMLEVIAGEDGLDPRQISVSVAGLRAALERRRRGPARRRAAPRASGSRTRPSPTSTRPCARPPTCWRRRARRSRRSRSRCTATGSRSGTRSPTEGATDLMVRGDALRHQPQGPLHDRPRRLLRPARRARGADYSVTVKLTALLGDVPVRGLQPPLLREGPQPRPAAGAPSTRRRSERFDVLRAADDRDEGAPRSRRDGGDPRGARRRARQPPQHVAVRRHRQPGPVACRAACRTACRSARCSSAGTSTTRPSCAPATPTSRRAARSRPRLPGRSSRRFDRRLEPQDEQGDVALRDRRRQRERRSQGTCECGPPAP